MIELDGLTKRFGRVLAVDELTATIPAGSVTGFVGPNGAGKTTTMRMVAGLDLPTAGRARVVGQPIQDAAVPLRTLGVVFDGRAALGSRRSVDQLRWIAQANRLPGDRVATVLSSAASPVWPTAASGGCRWGCTNASLSRPRCSATRRY